MTKTSRIYRFDLFYELMKIYLLFVCLFIGVNAQKATLLKNKGDLNYGKVFSTNDLPTVCNSDFKGGSRKLRIHTI